MAKSKANTRINHLLLIAVIGLAVYFNSFFNGFVWDDEEQIVLNSVIHSLKNLPLLISGATFSSGGGPLTGWFFRPLLTINYALLYAVFSAHAFGYHLFQVVFHILNAALLYLLLNRLLPKNSSLIHLLAALFYVVHPGINEAVVYIAALSEVMYTFLILLSLYLVIPAVTPKRGLLAFFLLLAASVYKEPGLIGFIIVPIFIFHFSRPKIASLLLGISGLATYFFLRLLIVKTPIGHPQFSPISQADLITRILTVPLEIFDYLRLTAFPLRLAVSQHYVFTGFSSPLTLLAILCTLVLLAVSFWSLAVSALRPFALWVGGSFVIIANLFPLDMTIAERWWYFPLLGVIMFAVAAIHLFKPKIRLTDTHLYIAAAVLLLLSLRTVARNFNWHDGLSLYTHDINYSPRSFDLENNLGVELFRAGEFAKAKGHFENSISLQPDWHFAYNNLGAVYQQAGDATKATELYQETLKRSDYYLAYENLATLYFQLQQYQPAFNVADNGSARLPNNAKLWLIKALAADKLDKSSEALMACQNAYRLTADPQIYSLCSRLKLSRG